MATAKTVKTETPAPEPTAEELKKQLAETQAALQAAQSELLEQKQLGAGWLVTTPNVAYDGITLGIKFENGSAFILEKKDYPQIDTHILKDSEYKKIAKDNKAEADAIREREKVPSSQRLAEKLASDFGYTITRYSGLDTEEVEAVLSRRANERRQHDALIEQAQQQAEIMGGARYPVR